MKSENKRIFISDLPETSTKDELETSFSPYGEVSSVEIKERKELGPNNKSLFFAYVNLITDDKRLNQCFQALSNTPWHGQYVQLQIARESFLERLKRERQEAEGKTNNNTVVNGNDSHISIKKVHTTKKYVSSSESETDSSDTDTKLKTKIKPTPFHNKNVQTPKKYVSSSESETDSSDTDIKVKPNPNTEEQLDIVIKSNKNKLLDKDGLKIPSLGKAPIVQITKNKAKQNDSEANKKRLQSLRDMKKGYATQKTLIKNALSYGKTKANNKIVFDCDGSNNSSIEINNGKKLSLFDGGNAEDDSDIEVNFDVKEQFQGKSGQKLLELQSRYKHDKRFNLDERFIEAEEAQNEVEDDVEAEKNEQFRILEEVLGKKLTPKPIARKDGVPRKTMVKFDPLHPDHSNLELTMVSQPENKKRKKDKLKEQHQVTLKPGPEVSKDVFYKFSDDFKPEVSKDVFYKFSDTFKDTLADNPQCSLLSMFGKSQETSKEEHLQEEQTEIGIKRSSALASQNPFKYDSSDDDDEPEDIPHKDSKNIISSSKNIEVAPARTNQSVFWTEPFFFKSDDFRLQEGLDFVEKIKTENKEFLQIRRELKGIVKAKVRNNERKNKMFKKKLGGSRRRKHIRIKKALKR